MSIILSLDLRRIGRIGSGLLPSRFRGSSSRSRGRRVGPGAVVLALLLIGGAGSSLTQEPAPVIEITGGVEVEVYTNESLAYRIIATSGAIEEVTRIVHLDDPRVSVFGPDDTVREEFRARKGRMWPVRVMTLSSQGTLKEVTKYNWSLSGDVVFQSSQGYRIKSETLIFSSQDGTVSSDDRVEYRIRSRDGGFLEGQAGSFEALIDPETGASNQWLLGGPVKLGFAPVESEVE
ncbi:hypothetical protein IIC65_01610 [Candidatus Sumerlaeota bacterium]|nr:hypothetical protein [Candidatus Sumerlaeota bacterium]